jgi:hypothetical protein
MTGQLPNPVPHAPPESDASAHENLAVPGPHGTQRRFGSLLRRLSTFAPLAVAYGVFQAVLSSLPPSLSYANVHYLLAIASGIAAGAAAECAVLLARRAEPDGGPRLAVTRSAPPAGNDLPTLARACHQKFLSTMVTFNDPDLGELTGWPHFLHEAAAGYRPTAYGTAYGLKLAVIMGDQDGRLDRAALAETLWKLRRSDGGWASRTQGGVGRPEVTALVLGAMASAGCDALRLAEAGDVFESMIAPGADPIAMTSTSRPLSPPRPIPL